MRLPETLRCRAAPAQGAPQSLATLQPGDEAVTEPPSQKITNKKASFSGLDKITGRIINFDEDIGETVQARRASGEDRRLLHASSTEANTDAFVEVDEITLQGEVKRIFSGWMFAASPGLHGVEHPIYDIWLTDCVKARTRPSSTLRPDPEAEPPPPAQKRPAPQKQAAPRPLPPPQFQQQPQQVRLRRHPRRNGWADCSGFSITEPAFSSDADVLVRIAIKFTQIARRPR